MEFPKDFDPMRRRWFVERKDFGRQIAIVCAYESTDGQLQLLQYEPSGHESSPPCPLRYKADCLTGCEPMTAFFSHDEAQELMDAMWEAGLRPTRR